MDSNEARRAWREKVAAVNALQRQLYAAQAQENRAFLEFVKTGGREMVEECRGVREREKGEG